MTVILTRYMPSIGGEDAYFSVEAIGYRQTGFIPPLDDMGLDPMAHPNPNRAQNHVMAARWYWREVMGREPTQGVSAEMPDGGYAHIPVQVDVRC